MGSASLNYTPILLVALLGVCLCKAQDELEDKYPQLPVIQYVRSLVDHIAKDDEWTRIHGTIIEVAEKMQT